MKDSRHRKLPSEYLSDDLEWLRFRKEVLRRSDEELKIIQLTVAEWALEQSLRLCN